MHAARCTIPRCWIPYLLAAYLLALLRSCSATGATGKADGWAVGSGAATRPQVRSSQVKQAARLQVRSSRVKRRARRWRCAAGAWRSQVKSSQVKSSQVHRVSAMRGRSVAKRSSVSSSSFSRRWLSRPRETSAGGSTPHTVSCTHTSNVQRENQTKYSSTLKQRRGEEGTTR